MMYAFDESITIIESIPFGLIMEAGYQWGKREKSGLFHALLRSSNSCSEKEHLQ